MKKLFRRMKNSFQRRLNGLTTSLPEHTVRVTGHGQTSNTPRSLLEPIATVSNYMTPIAPQVNLPEPVAPIPPFPVLVSSSVSPAESLYIPTQRAVQAPATHKSNPPDVPVSNGIPETKLTMVPKNQAPEQVSSPPQVHATPTHIAAGRAIISDMAWGGLERLMSIMSKIGGTFAPLESVRDDLGRCVEVFEAVSESQKDYNNLKVELQHTLNQLCDFFGDDVPLSQMPCIVSLAKGIEAEILFVIRKLNRTKAEGSAGAAKDHQEIAGCQSRVQGMLNRLQLNADLKTWKTVDEIAAETRLTRLPIAEAAKHRSAQSSNLRRVGCTPDTRIGVLEDLKQWANDNSSEKIYWLNGMAGTGKTTITYSFCEQLKASERLAASFYCSRQLPSCRSVNRIVPTISYQLALFSRPFRDAVSGVLQTLDIHNQLLPDQFESLVARPLREIHHTLPFGLVIVIDALDECEDGEGVGQILEVLLSHTDTLPVKVFVASRPDTKIIDRLRSEAGGRASKELRLHELDSSVVHSDIMLYLSSKLRTYKNVAEDDIELLAMKSGVLFIYAATVVRYIESGGNSRGAKRLNDVITSYRDGTSVAGGERDIDQLYTTILESVIDDPGLTDEDQAQIKVILWTVICAQEPLSIHAVAELLDLDDETIVGPALRSLSSVLQISDENGVVTTLHASFPDYLLNIKRSGAFYCDSGHTNAQILEKCFRQIKSTRVPFNICDLKSSHLLDGEEPELSHKVKREISEALLYSCRYWGAHIRLGTNSIQQDAALFAFLSTRLLLWMEILNLRKCIHDGVGLLYDVRRWYESEHKASQSVQELLRDAWEFVSSFSSEPVLLSTAHIYVSHLSFWPDDRPVSRLYRSEAAKLVTAASTAPKVKRKTAIQVMNVGEGAVCFGRSAGTRIVVGYESGSIKIWDSRTGKPVGEPLHGHTDPIYSVGYSLDGAYIVSGSDDMTLRIWDAQTGKPVGEPLLGHTSSVSFAGYSPDGTYIVSSSDDNTVRIWDARTGQPVGEPLHGHTGWVLSVGYSPDGAHIVSGSLDETVRIWNARTGQSVGKPLLGHTGSVNSVGYSSDGAYIVSGSDDETVRIWDARTGQPVGDPLQGHTGWVLSVGYSPDGAYIVSGSFDETVRIWDARTGQPVGEPLHGHTGWVNSVGYSPDGAYIVSSSYDTTVRIWDARAGQPVGEPFHGHTGWVTSLGYSPNGEYIVSGSDDKTVRIWDARTGQPVGRPLRGHTRLVKSVGYSPDGAYIVSSSDDETVRIWDARTGQQVGHPLHSHTDPVLSVGYSPNEAYIVSGSDNETVRIWDARTIQPVGEPSHGHTGSVSSVGYSPDSAYFVSGSGDKTVRIWDARTGQPVGEPLRGHTRLVKSVGYSPDGAYIVSGSLDKTVRIWDARTGQPVGEPLHGHTRSVTSVGYSPDGAYIVSGSEDSTVRIWDARTRQPVAEPLHGHTSSVWSVGYSPDGVYIVSGSLDKTVRIWDARIGQQMGEPLHGHTRSVLSVGYSPDGAYIVSGSYDGTVRIWGARTGRQVGEPLHGHTGLVTSVGYSPDGEYIVSGSLDKTVRIWDARNGQQVGEPFHGHTRLVLSVGYSPDGAYIVSGSLDKTVRIWDARTGQPIESLAENHSAPVIYAAQSPDGEYRVARSGENIIIERLQSHTILTTQSSLYQGSSISETPNVPYEDAPHICNSSCEVRGPHRSWSVNEHGWVTLDDNKRLAWIPAELRDQLLKPNHKVLISRRGSLQLEFHLDGVDKIGDNWAEYFKPQLRDMPLQGECSLS